MPDSQKREKIGPISRFAETAGEGGRIATAHTLDDTIETVLMNLIRGTGLHGLCGIPRIRGNIVRPLLDVTRAEVEEYLALLGLSLIHISEPTRLY